MSRTEILMGHCWISAHLVSTHMITHLHLILAALLIKVLHLTVISRIIILAIIMRRRIMIIWMPIERIVSIVLVAQRWITAGRYGRRWGSYHTGCIASQRC